MQKYYFTCLILFFALTGQSQLRNGWRALFDKEGRLSRMYYYVNGISVPDSNYYFQYYAENAVKARVNGEVRPQINDVDGAVALFDPSGYLSSYHIKKGGFLLFDVDCQLSEECRALWSDGFDVDIGSWQGHGVLIEGGYLLLQQDQEGMAYGVYQPELPIDLSYDFDCRVVIPEAFTDMQPGIALWWKDEKNHLLFEWIDGVYFSVSLVENGEKYLLSNSREGVENKGDGENELLVRRRGSDLLFEINNRIEFVTMAPDFDGNQIALVSGTDELVLFDAFSFTSELDSRHLLTESMWLGRGTGFFIGPAQILTSYEAVAGVKNMRVKGRVGGKVFEKHAHLSSFDEANNLAVLELSDTVFAGFETLPYGYSMLKPASGSAVFSPGFPNAVSCILTPPEVYQGELMSVSSGNSVNMTVSLPFRYGMTGAPVFDNKANLIGLYSGKGQTDLQSEILPLYGSALWFSNIVQNVALNSNSPIRNESRQQKEERLSELVVIVQSGVFSQ